MSDVHLNFSSVSTFNTSLYSIPCKHGLRNRNSAVCVINLIPCRTFSFSPKHILLTRWQMQSLEEEKSIAMSCSSLYRTKSLLLILQRLVGMIIRVHSVRMLHQGRDTYNHHYGKKRGHDYYFNSQFYDDKYQRSATLSCASFRFSRCIY